MKDQTWFSWKMQTSKTWSDMAEVLKYTKVDFIDYDHKMLVEYALKLNQLINKMDKDFSLDLLEETGELLNDLYTYAVDHFQREEIFMEAYNLPEIEAHKIVHDDILRVLYGHVNDFNNGKIRVGQDLKSQIMEWLIYHINDFDFKFFEIENWSENLSEARSWDQVKDIISLTGLKDIDLQHKELTVMAIDLLNDLEGSTSPEAIEEAYEAFSSYVEMHFAYEQAFIEKYMIKSTFNHEEEHDFFLDKIKTFKDKLLENPGGVKAIKKWILTWWINHINVTDFKTFEFSNWAYTVIDRSKTIEEMLILLRRTDINPIDGDHIDFMRLTFDLNNKINEYKAAGRQDLEESKAEINAILNALYNAALNHFYREEAMMLDYDLRDYQSHKREHEAILKRIKTLQEDYGNNRLYASQNIKNMILDWWINHTNTIDYRTFIIHTDEDQRRQMKGGSHESY